MDQPHSPVPHKRCMDRPAAPDKAGALYEIIPLFQLFNKSGNILNAVLIIAIDSDNAIVTALQSPPKAHAKLRSLLAGLLLDKQCIDA